MQAWTKKTWPAVSKIYASQPVNVSHKN